MSSGTGVFSRIRTIMRAKADQQVDRFETPDVLARDAVRRIETDLSKLQVSLQASKQAEIQARRGADQARQKAEALRSRAQGLLNQGNKDMAVAAMRQALLSEYKAETLASQSAELQQVNDSLTTKLSELSEQRTVIRMQAQVEMGAYAAARAAQLGAEASFGKAGEIGRSPYERLEQARDRSEEIVASAMATVEIGQSKMDLPALAAGPDFSFEAERALGLIGGQLPGGPLEELPSGEPVEGYLDAVDSGSDPVDNGGPAAS